MNAAEVMDLVQTASHLITQVDNRAVATQAIDTLAMALGR